jgi:chemotaxis protein MotB
MDDAPHPEIVIVRRRGGHEEEHHGGAWKIAFADFMTAMMAFFLVLWIINATDKDTKTIIARYFNPVKLEESSRTPKSIHGDGSATPAVDASDGTQTAKSKQSGPVGAAKTPDDPPPPAATSGLDKPGGNPPGAAANLGDPAAPKANMTEGVLFADPYSSLDSIAGSTSPNMLAILRRDAANGAPANDGLPDPFRLAAREVTPESDSSEPPKPPAVAAAPPTPAQSVVAPTPQPTLLEPTPPAAAANEVKPPPGAAAEAKPTTATAARLQKELELQIAPPGAARLGPAVDVKATDEGLLISITDKMNFMMFAIGSAEPQPQLIQAMDAIASLLKQQQGAIVVRGHTDAHPYKSPTYDNWRLSSARAQMAYYMLTRAGLPESRFERIEGYADKRLRDPAHPFAAENRRIEILLKGAKP